MPKPVKCATGRILDQFLPFYSPRDPENLNFQNMKIRPGDIILHMCIININDNHMMYGSLDMELDGQNVLSFPPLPPTAPFPNNPKYQRFAKIKKKAPADIIILYMCTINNNHMMYGS